MRNLLPILGNILKLDALAGFRTYLAALGLFGLSLSQFADGNYDGAMTSLLAALALVGLRDAKPPITPEPPHPGVGFSLVLAAGRSFKNEFREAEAEINRRRAELDASIARGCRRTDGNI